MSMLIGGGCLGDGTAWAIEDHPDDPFNRPSDQSIYQHGDQGRDFQHHATRGWSHCQAGKWEQEQVGETINKHRERVSRVGGDQFQDKAQGEESLRVFQETTKPIGWL